MSHRNNKGKNPKQDLTLNLLPMHRGGPSTTVTREGNNDNEESPNRSSTSSSLTSPPSSCVSSEEGEKKKSDSPEAAKSMVLAGCPRCLMYVMLSEEEEPKCPKCNSTVLLDFNYDNNNNNNKTGKC